MSWRDLPGWFDFEDVYSEIAESVPDGGRIVEVGVFMGRSAAFLAHRLLELGKTRVQLYLVDTWEDDGNWSVPDGWTGDRRWGGEYADAIAAKGGPFSAFLEGMLLHARRELEFCRVLRCSSADASWAIDTPLHAVFVDAAHDYDNALRDIRTWGPLVSADGILAGHDYPFSGVKRAVNESFAPGTFEVRGSSWVVKAVKAGG